MKTKMVWLVLIVPFLFVINSCSEDPIIEETFSVEGIVTYLGTPVSDVQVKHHSDSTSTDSSGFFKFINVNKGSNTFTLSHPEFLTNQITINITGNTNLPIQLNIDNDRLSIEGIIVFEDTPVTGATIEFGNITLLTDSSGYFIIDRPGAGNHSLKIIHPRFRTIDTLINLTRKVSLTFNLGLRADSFFPLAVGNKWYYSDQFIPDSNSIVLVREVIGTTMVAGNEYFKIQETPGGERLYRMSVDTLFERMCDSNTIYAIFNIDSGHTFQYLHCDPQGNQDLYDVKLSERTSNKLRFYYDIPIVFDDEHTVTFEKGAGLDLRIGAWSDPLKLWKYQIKY